MTAAPDDTQQPVTTERVTAYTFGGHDDRESGVFDNHRLALALRAAADWVDARNAHDPLWIEQVAVGMADEFGTWWITLYVKGKGR